MTTVLEQVSALIERLSPAPICDDCHRQDARPVGVPARHHQTRELAGIGGFERGVDRCGMCDGEKKVMRLRKK